MKNNILLTSLYDKNWNHTEEESKALFRTTIAINEESINANRSLYDISIEIIRLTKYFRSSDNNPTIHTIKTKLYIPTISEEIFQ